jgi:hypothetical protein
MGIYGDVCIFMPSENDDPGPNAANNDALGVPGDYLPAQQTGNQALWIPDWIRYAANLVCDGGFLSPMAVFLPQSNIFLALGQGTA